MNEKELKNISDIKIQTSNLIYGNTQPFHKHYKILSALGGGSFGKVFRCIHIATNQERAVKEIKLNNTKEDKGVIEDKIFKEVELLAQLDHPHIMKIFEYFKDESSFYIAMELLEGGDLYDYITKIKSFTEKDAAIIMSQLLSAVNYLHSKGIVHRDIKPENIAVEIPLEIERNPSKLRSKKEIKQILLPKSRDISSKRLIAIDSNKNNSPKLTNNSKATKRNSIPSTGKKILNSQDINIKLLDFGASCYFSKNRALTVKAGTPYYIAPEVIKKEYNNKCDIWSCGVILYVLLIGKPPFDGKNSQAVFERILTGVFDKTSKEWNRLSTYAKSLITDMLNLNYNNRPSAKDCLNHYWIKHNLDLFKSDNKLIYLTKKPSRNNMKYESISESESKSITDQKEEMVKDALDNLKRFSIKNKFQQATIAFLIHHVADKSIFENLKEIFKEFDVDNDGILTYEEIKNGFSKYNNSNENTLIDYDEVIKKLDQDHSNTIEYEEFLRNLVDMRLILTKKNLKIAFDMFDTDGNGELSINEIRDTLGVIESESSNKKNNFISKLLNSFDSDGNGTISYDEFEKLMLSVLDNTS